MPVYRVYINHRDTKNFIATSNLIDAYEEVSDLIVRDYNDDLDLKPVNSPAELNGVKGYKGKKLI